MVHIVGFAPSRSMVFALKYCWLQTVSLAKCSVLPFENKDALSCNLIPEKANACRLTFVDIAREVIFSKTLTRSPNYQENLLASKPVNQLEN